MVNQINLIFTLPFVLMLATIAIFPLVLEFFWHKNLNKLLVSVSLSLPVILWAFLTGYTHVMFDTLLFDYLPFIILIGSLFVISGGIHLDSNITSRPETNTIFLVLGAVLASFLGTTGAAMLIVHPLIKILNHRKYKTHTFLFLIAIVANTGGLLTPVGDPPLFMLFLRGAPFFWFLKLFPEWLFVNGLLITIYFFIDRYYFRKEESELHHPNFKAMNFKVEGKLNFLWLLIVILAVVILTPQNFNIDSKILSVIRDVIIVLMIISSLKFTSKKIRKSNNFGWHPIEEVAYLFLGIFITMIPCILYLESNAATLAKNSPSFFYYISGFLSSFLDNTPTAVTMHSLAKGMVDANPAVFTGNLVAGIPESFLKAISLGSVFFGSMTYIGNGPNFMIKAMAEHNGVKMPHFFEYIFKFSLIILLPIYILVQLLFI
jgi:Na+/H+ antiporter NhaD/arsenite permease-like protein